MNLDDIKDLKDKVYELEGLLELAQLREDKIDELEPLIRTRIAGLLVEEEAASDPAFEEDAPARVPTETPKSLRTINEVNEIKEPALADVVNRGHGPDKTKEVKAKEVKEQKEANKPAFCINDRFRFRRELFNGSDSEFAAAMNVVASMENYEEAEDYFLGELGWNPEDENVQDFLAIIEGYFKKE